MKTIKLPTSFLILSMQDAQPIRYIIGTSHFKADIRFRHFSYRPSLEFRALRHLFDAHYMES
jgi:hypothetical protein